MPATIATNPFCVTRSNPTHQLTDPTKRNPPQVEKIAPNPTQPNTANTGAYSSAVTHFYKQNLSRTFRQPSVNLVMVFTDHYTH